MDDKATEKKLPNIDADYHEYDELEDRPEESTLLQNQKNNNNSIEIEAANIPPPLPAPKQIQSNSKSKLKSKIPRSPSLASCLSNQQPALNNLSEGPLVSPNYLSKECGVNESLTRVKPLSTQDKTINANQNVPNAVIMGDTKLPHEGLIAIGNLTSDTNGSSNHRSSISMVPPRRPQTQISLKNESPKNFQYLTLTVRKDENGYGMKVSGDNPVFVESVKAGGAAQIAGLVAGDMILKVNGQEVRSEKHPTVVSLIKASTIVELSVKRSHKVTTRPSSVNVVPSTPILSGRDRTASITGPQPVDSIKRREMESYKIHTLQKMLEQEKINLERLKGDTNNPSYKLSETNIRKLREQLRQIGAEDAPATNQQQLSNNKNKTLLSPNQAQNSSTSSHHQPHHQFNNQSTTPQPQSQHSSPAFLSLLPRSLSSLSLGTRKNKIEKDITSCHVNNANDFFHNNSQNTSGTSKNYSQFIMSQSLQQPSTQMQRSSTQQQLFYQQATQHASKEVGQQQKHKDAQKLSNIKSKNKFVSKSNSLIEEDSPPPLPQRNPPRQVQVESESGGNNQTNNSNINNSFALISDLDLHSPQRNSFQSNGVNANRQQQSENNMKSKRSKNKIKALSDPKMSTQMFLLMESTSAGPGNNNANGKNEVDCVPPPLPPRQSGLADESHRGSSQNLNNNNCVGLNRTVPNSVDSILNYPLVSTCTVVHRDNLAVAFPLSQRPNIVQQLHQHQQHQQQQKQEHKPQTSDSALGQTPQNINLNNKHRRIVSSPENMQTKNSDRQNKATSGSWELIEKDGEITPPGTPPPPYLTPHSNSISDGGIFVESHHFVPIAGIPNMPSGSLQHSNRIQAAQSSTSQKEIMSMEDEDASDQDGPFIDENGPFNYFQRLLEPENVGFLAVFLNYVLSNSEPAPLLFYLITGLYKEGTAKDMRKWAYEIHSTFLVPRAPLAWYRQDESLAREVDNVLQTEFDKVEILRKVFWKSRKRARDIICNQLRDFQQKRAAGLGTIYGPTDAQLAEAKGDKQREQHIFEETLMRKLQILIDEHEKELPIEDPKKLALCSALSTVVHRIFITRAHPNNIIDRVHHFVSREKSFKSRLMAKSMKKITIRGHPLVLRQYYEVTHCNHCQTIIWGVRPQGYHCTDCKLNIHRSCSKVLDESCPGPVPQSKRKDPHNDNKISKIMGKIRPRTSSDFIAAEKRGRHEDEFEPLELTHERLNSSISIVRHPSDRRPDINNSSNKVNGNLSTVLNTSDLQSSLNNSATFPDASSSITGSSVDGGTQQVNSTSSIATTPEQTATAGNSNVSIGACINTVGSNALDAATESCKDILRERFNHQQNKSAPVSVNRSESYKERLSNKRNRHTRRKTSDPSLTSRKNDEQTELGLSNCNYRGSSDLSFSSGSPSESPSTSMEQVGAAATNATINQHQHVPQTHHHSHQDSFHGSIGSTGSNNTSFWGTANTSTGQVLRPLNFESEDDDEVNETDWSSLVAAETLATLTDAEKKRQEIINEIYQTERSHVRTLKLLDRLFFCPLQENNVLSQDHLMLLFPPALISLRELHSAFEQKIKLRRLEHNHVVNHIGDLLASMFDGPAGDDLREYAAQFCARQQIALEALKEKRRKDEQLQKLLNKAESHKACRRLQLKDLLPAVLQRLTKYPLLFENLYKVTIRVVPENTSEAEAIQRALESSKKILVDVNQAVKTAEDAHKLQNIQRKLDKSTFDKDEFKNLDLTHYRLIHDGSLTMKKNPGFQLHGLLFETMIVLLTKQDDKYSLKYLHAARNTEVNNKPVSPIMSIDSDTLVRQEAADKNSFFLIKTKTSQMLELRAPSSSECKTWFKHISDAAEQYKPRSKNTNLEPLDDPAIATIPHSNTKESFELTPERIAPQSATATITTTPLAPLLPLPMSNLTFNNNEGLQNTEENVQFRKDKTNTTSNNDDNEYYNISNMPLSHNNLQTATSPNINRTMSTRSCGESNTHGATNIGTSATSNGVTLRHTQSARHANETGSAEDTKRESASIVYSNNSNDTKTLLMQSPLVQPTAIQISVSPAHTAEPVLTPAERLRRLDTSICDGLLEKQKIICEMFRVPIEHFDEIVDIAAMPEAPKDSADIALAAYDQIQKLTKLVNGYMNVKPEQIISAVSTAVCDSCYKKDTHFETTLSNPKIDSSPNFVGTNKCKDNLPPPLPPPNRTVCNAQPQTPIPSMSKKLTQSINEPEFHEDDDGYCEIDELRLPGLPNQITFESYDSGSSQPPIRKNLTGASTDSTDTVTPVPPTSAEIDANEIVKNESSLSAEIIPEEKSSQEVNKDKSEIDNEINTNELTSTNVEECNKTSQNDNESDIERENGNEKQSMKIDVFLNEENVTTKCAFPVCTMVDTSTQTVNVSSHEDNPSSVQCGTNRLQHVRSLEPSVPCHALNSIVSALNEQISLLLPKINDRDMERERLRKENQHLRELLNAMHGRQRVPETLETQETIESQGPEEISGGEETSSTTETNPSVIQADDETNIPKN